MIYCKARNQHIIFKALVVLSEQKAAILIEMHEKEGHIDVILLLKKWKGTIIRRTWEAVYIITLALSLNVMNKI